MTTSGANSVSSGFLPKWQVALAVGAPVALGLGYMYYKNSTKSSSKPDRGKSKSSTKNGTCRDKQISIDGECSTKVSSTSSAQETPLEKVQRYKNKGNELFKSGKYDEAISNYNKGIETCPVENSEDLAKLYQNRAAAYEQLQNYNAVKTDCTKALELKPKYVKALVRRARVLEQCDELESALHDATAVCILESFSNTTTLMLVDKVLKQLGKQHAQEHLAQKKPIMPSKHFIKTYMSSFYKDPIMNMLQNSQNSSPGFSKIQEAMKNQKYDDIIQLCTEEMENIIPEELSYKMELLLLRATFYLLSGDHDAAISDFQTIVDTEASSTEVIVNALIKRASLYVQLENPEKSFNDFDWAVKIGPNFGDIYHHRGQVNLLLEKIEDAKADFDKAVELHPDYGIAYVQKCYTDYRYGIISKDVDVIENPMKNFEKAIKKFPDCVEGYTLYAHLLTETQNYSQADDLFAKATEIDPKNATIYVHRGLLHLQCYANLEKGIEYINKALELDDKCEIAYETLGTIEVQRGNLKEAIDLFDKALALGRTSMELTHIFSLRDAAKAQLTIKDRLGLD